MFFHHKKGEERASSIAEDMDLELEEFNQLLDHIPEAITSREPAEFTEFDEVSVADLKAALFARG